MQSLSLPEARTQLKWHGCLGPSSARPHAHARCMLSNVCTIMHGRMMLRRLYMQSIAQETMSQGRAICRVVELTSKHTLPKLRRMTSCMSAASLPAIDHAGEGHL